MDGLVETFLATMAVVGFLVGIGLFFLLLGLGVRSLYRKVTRRGKPLVHPESVQDETLMGTAQARLHPQEAFDRATGVFPPFDPRSQQFLHWMRQEWQKASRDGTGSGDPRVRHAFYLQVARQRLDELVAEGGLTRQDAESRLAGMRQILADAEVSRHSATM